MDRMVVEALRSQSSTACMCNWAIQFQCYPQIYHHAHPGRHAAAAAMIKNAVIDLAATEPETVPSAPTVAAVSSQLRVQSETHAPALAVSRPTP